MKSLTAGAKALRSEEQKSHWDWRVARKARILVQVMEEGNPGVKMLKWVWSYSCIVRVLASQFLSTA